MSDRLTTKDKWEDIWATVPIPQTQKPDNDTVRQMRSHLPRDNSLSLCEVGCAPGGWMAYFARSFGFRVAGIEYAENAAEITRRNLAIQDIPAQVQTADFFSEKVLDQTFDVVFSSGFIEHFEDTCGVVERHATLANEYVVILVPNLYGINGFISKTIRPQVYAEHKGIDRNELARVATECGLEVLFCDYVGGVMLIMPATHRPFFKNHPWLSKMLNAPVRVFNKLSDIITGCFNMAPRWRACSKSLLLIAKKKPSC